MFFATQFAPPSAIANTVFLCRYLQSRWYCIPTFYRVLNLCGSRAQSRRKPMLNLPGGDAQSGAEYSYTEIRATTNNSQAKQVTWKESDVWLAGFSISTVICRKITDFATVGCARKGAANERLVLSQPLLCNKREPCF